MKVTDSLGNRYRLDERIAVGGMGEVWRAHDEVLGRDVAVKVLRRDLADDQEFVDRFRDEARHTASLSHPNIAAVHDYAESDGVSYLVMELVDGEPLSELLAREGALPVERTLDLLAQVALALQAAHDAGVIHRDIKPGNLLVRPDGTVKVTDFGIARAAEATAGRTQTGTVLGTAYYMPPESARGEQATAASDVYALGVVGYECLAGARPFTATNPVAVATAHLHDVPPPLPTHVPREVTRLVLSCLAKDPALRPSPASAVSERALALRAALAPTAPATLALPALDDTAGAVAAATTQVAPAALAEPYPEDPYPRWRSDAPGQRRVRRNLMLLGAVAVLLGFLVLRSCDGGPTKPVATKPTTRPVTTVQVIASAYVGRDSVAVLRELTALGVRPVPHLVTPEDGDVATGTVLAVRPAGSVTRGAIVTVDIAQQPPSGNKKHGHGKGKGGDD